ncbi:hypothetical protein T12_8385 [Trichinella patagoniensis]|uniref:Uncharacterized protein n=1 Tax=Trichinella patagoniensis TaxID=990121 RepID=A0A0V1A923_9BILA|nr:hypothetical protein T12_8385 [Trichinella patagoniensis]
MSCEQQRKNECNRADDHRRCLSCCLPLQTPPAALPFDLGKQNANELQRTAKQELQVSCISFCLIQPEDEAEEKGNEREFSLSTGGNVSKVKTNLPENEKACSAAASGGDGLAASPTKQLIGATAPTE